MNYSKYATMFAERELPEAIGADELAQWLLDNISTSDPHDDASILQIRSAYTLLQLCAIADAWAHSGVRPGVEPLASAFDRQAEVGGYGGQAGIAMDNYVPRHETAYPGAWNERPLIVWRWLRRSGKTLDEWARANAEAMLRCGGTIVRLGLRDLAEPIELGLSDDLKRARAAENAAAREVERARRSEADPLKIDRLLDQAQRREHTVISLSAVLLDGETEWDKLI